MTPYILFEDNHLLAVYKPAGWLTQPTPQEADSLETWAKAWIKTTHQKPGNVFLHAVHRLDRPVEGIVLFAKTSKALSRLNASLREKGWEKIYFAEVEGKLPHVKGVLEHTLLHGEHEAVEDPKGKLCRLYYQQVGKGYEITLETGRYHQIRAQLSLSGAPIQGDVKYGAKPLPGGKIALSHIRLTFPHPVTGLPVHLVAVKAAT